MTTQTLETKIRIPLLILRVTLSLFLLLWAIDKFIAPEHTAAVFSHFYFMDGLSTTVAYVLGGLQTALCLALIAGFMRNITYLLAFLIHSVSTLATYKHIFMPYMFEGWMMLFWTGVPVLAAFWLLYQVREWDTLSIDGKKPEVASLRTPSSAIAAARLSV